MVKQIGQMIKDLTPDARAEMAAEQSVAAGGAAAAAVAETAGPPSKGWGVEGS